MALTLKITSYQSQTLGADSSKLFTEAGGSIGRAQGNDWVLPDPERYISGRHALISFQDGSYFLTDTSTNGVFVNGSEAPLGNGNSVPLNHGDRVNFGDYEIEAGLDADVITSPPSGQWGTPAASGDIDVLITSPTGRPDMPESLDPLSFTSPPASDRDIDVPDPFAPQPMPPGAEADHVPSPLEAFQPPAASVEQIPDDWDMTGYATSPGEPPMPESDSAVLPTPVSPVPSPAASIASDPVVPPLTSQAPVESPPVPRPAASVTTATVDDDLFAAFLRGAGIDPASMDQVNTSESMESYGALFREVVQGLMEVLMARASLKSEFRMPLTTIRPVENNPLKFSPSVDDAMHNLFMSHGSGYLSPVEAVREGFEDIKSHQMAMVAGMQAAFGDMLQRVKPESFLDNDRGGVRGALMSMNRKSRAWDAYCEFFSKVTLDADSSFQTLFGEEFARAYEEQIQRLASSRRK